MRTIVVLSTMVDSTIRAGQSDTDFILFNSIEELGEYIELTPVRADKMYITKEILRHTNTSISLLATMLDNPFLAVEKVIFITEPKSREIPSLNYLIEKNGYTNWEVLEGFMTREYVNSVVSGTACKTELSAKRKVVYRVPRDEYLEGKAKERPSMEEEYPDDEERLKDIPSENMPFEPMSEGGSTCESIHIAGLPGYERTAMSFILAQYLSLGGKTLILEKDVEYHRLTEIATKSDVDLLMVDMEELLEDPQEVFRRITNCTENLIVVGCIPRIDYSYSFILNILYSNLSDILSSVVVENDIAEIPELERHIVVLPTLVPEVIQTCEQIDNLNAAYAKFVGVQLGGLNELRIDNSRCLQTIVSDLLEMEAKRIPVIQIDSLKIGGEANDLRSIIEDR